MAIVTNIDLLINRRTKIVATVGPSCASRDQLRALLDAGVNIFRLNMSHGDHAMHKQALLNIREVANDGAIAVLADLCGPKIRTGKFEKGGINLVRGKQVCISTVALEGRDGLIVSQYDALARDVREGDRILLADGLFELRVTSTSAREVDCEVVHGGFLTDNKGMNLPGVAVSAPSMTDKDIDDANFAMSLGVDLIALSFVRTASDIHALRALLEAGMIGEGDVQQQMVPGIVAKIEKPEALDNAESILEATDAIMIARGDLGVELPPEQVPIAQDELISLARYHGKPVIVATQMLESMITHSRPTRAEVTDVSHAVTCGADAVMLSAETAAGEFPVESVHMMDRVARHAEAHLWRSGAWGREHKSTGKSEAWKVVAAATSLMSRELDARAVIVVSQTGISAQLMSAARPAAPIIALTGNRRVFYRMALFWGVVPLFDEAAGRANPNELAREVTLNLGLANPGQTVLLVRGFHDEPSMNLPSVTVLTL